MKICHVCQYACEDDAEICPICGAQLDLDQETEAEPAEIIIERPEIVATVNDLIVAEVFCDRLKENGILFTTDEADLSSTMHMGFGGFYTEINIYVDQEDYDAAKAIFDSLPDLSDCGFEDEFDGEDSGEDTEADSGEF